MGCKEGMHILQILRFPTRFCIAYGVGMPITFHNAATYRCEQGDSLAIAKLRFAVPRLTLSHPATSFAAVNAPGG